MRILHLITRLIVGGAQENTVLNCQDLVRQHGDDVLLVTGPPQGPEGSLLDDARRREVPLQVLPSLRRDIHPWHDPLAYRAIRRVIQDFRPEVVHTHSAKAGLLGRAAAWSLEVPAVIHGVHGAPFHPYQSAAARSFFCGCERWAARRCHAMISVADAMTDLMVAANVAPRTMFTTIYSGMEVEEFIHAKDQRKTVRERLGYAPQHIVIGKIARLFRLKGHADVVDAAKKVVRSEPNARFLFVGDGTLADEMRRRVANAGLSDHVRFHGLVPPAEIPGLIGAMDILVHASLREGLARTLPQALIAGVPAVTYDVDGAREVVRTGETGELVPPRDVEALTAALDRLVADASLREAYGEAGRQFVERFRHQNMTQQVRALYERILSERGSTPP